MKRSVEGNRAKGSESRESPNTAISLGFSGEARIPGDNVWLPRDLITAGPGTCSSPGGIEGRRRRNSTLESSMRRRRTCSSPGLNLAGAFLSSRAPHGSECRQVDCADRRVHRMENHISRCIDTAAHEALDFTLGKTPWRGVRPTEQRGRRRGSTDRLSSVQEVWNPC